MRKKIDHKSDELEETATITGTGSIKKNKIKKKKGSNTSITPKKKKKKNRVGKSLFSLILILGISGWVFWLGWVQLDLPENTYGIIHTKTSGYNPTPVAPEGITWMWEKVIPTNMTIHLFEIKTESATVNETGKLPMADLYASVIEDKVDFSYRFTAKIFYKINPQNLVGLIETGNLSKDEEGQWQIEINNEVTTAMRKYLYGKMSTSAESSKPDIVTIEKEMAANISSLIPEIEIEDIKISRFELPGSDIYTIAKTRYKERLKTRETVRDRLIAETIIDNENFDQTIKRMEKMGAVLEKYPILLDYFKMNPSNGINDFKP